MSVLEDAADHLEDNGLGTVGTDIFLSVLPQSPDVCTALFEYAGSAPKETMGTMLARPRLQVVCRAGRDDYPTARDAALDALARALRLDEAEQLHLRNLAHAARVPARQRRTSGRSAPVSPVHVSMQRILDALTTVPAYVRDGRIDMVAANALARELHAPVFAFARAIR